MFRKKLWILFVSLRYLRTKRKDKGLASAVLALGGIAVGTIAILSVIGVMNGFQFGMIEDILEIRSYYLRIHPAGTELNSDLLKDVKKIK